MSGAGPPPVPFVLALGIVGHRPAAVGGDAPIEAARPRLAALLDELRAAAAATHARHRNLFADAAPRLDLTGALAEGADQLAAAEALARGATLRAVLPLPLDDYRRDFATADARDRFDRLLAGCTSVVALPPAADRAAAYALAGRAAVAHCDVLIALWDGEPARGRGGTADTVALALRRGRPVIHLPLDPAQPARLLWTGFAPFAAADDPDAVPARAADAAPIAELVERLLAPPADAGECAFLRAYLAEREWRQRLRVEYPLLLAATGTRPLRRGAWRAPPYAAGTRAEWETFHAGRDAHGVTAGLDLIEAAYGWSDRLAQHFAQGYRSGHVLNFLLGALAVLLGLTGLLFPGVKVTLAIAELATILAFVANTRVGVRRGWHRRWLDYRQLAERLRPMRSLKLLAAAAPDAPAAPAGGGTERWVDWYAAGIWRAAGGPAGALGADGAARRRFLAGEELVPQIRYHRENARQLSHLDHRLHVTGMLLFAVSIASCVSFVVLYFAAHEWLATRAGDFVFLSAGLPALGAAIFGIRTQGDFAASAARSLATARSLEAIGGALAEETSFAREVDLAEASARVMLADLAEWRTAYQQRRLELP